MFNSVQRIAGVPAEFGVQRKYLDGELHLVDNALAGTVAAVEQFEVTESVVRAVSVPMVNGFFRTQVAADMLGHDPAMFHDMFTSGTSENGNSYPDVAVSFGVAFVVTRFKSIQRHARMVRDFALFIAIFLLQVYAALLVSIFTFCLPAVRAGKNILTIRVFAASRVRATHRAIQRVATEFLSVRRQVGLPYSERLAAFLAGKSNWRLACSRSSVDAVISATSQTAVFTTGFFFARIAEKGLITGNAKFLDRHDYTSLFCDNAVFSPAGRECQITSAKDL